MSRHMLARGALNTAVISDGDCIMMARMKEHLNGFMEYFEDRGVTPADFPKAIIAHEFMSVAFLALTWAACYQIQPSQSPVFAPINKTITESNNFVVMKMRQSYETVISQAERRLGQEWLSKRGIDSGRMAVSLAESTCFRKLAKPVTIPAKLWLTFKFVQVANLNKSEGDNDVSQGRSTSRDKTADEEGKRRKRSRTTPSAVAAEREPGRGSAKVGGGRWGQGRGSKRKAICPPGGRRGESGCFVPASSAPRWVSLEAARSRRG